MGEAEATPPAARALRRSVGVVGATATSAGLAFAAIDYLGVVSVMAYAPGATAAPAILFGGVLVVLVAGIFSELNGLYPTAAGIRLYLARAVGYRTALSVSFTYMTTVVLVIAADAFLIGAALRHVLHEPTAVAYVWIVVLLGLAWGANLRGVRMAGGVQAVVTYTVLSGTAVLSVLALFHPGGGLHESLRPFGKGAFSAVQALAFALFLYAAFEWVTTTAEEARTPKVITRALFIAPVLLWVVSTLFALALARLVPFSALHHSAYPQLLMGKAALGTVGELWMLALTVLTALNTLNGGFLVASRFIYAAAREGTLPRRFAQLNANAVPWLAVTVLAGASAAVAAAVFATGEWLLLVAVGAAIEAGIYAVGSFTLLVLRRRETRERPFRLVAGRPLAAFGVVLFSVLFFATALSDPRDASRFSLAPLGVIAALAAPAVCWVVVVAPRRRAAEAARSAGERPRRRPQRPAAAVEEPAAESAGETGAAPVDA
jgi:APA family basic amino acid/polyamine antiporter